MKKICFLFFILICGSVQAQKVVTQQFAVRKITFRTTDQITPISGVQVEINKAKFKSNSEGLFTANIPLTQDRSFFLSKVIAPGYVLSIPEDLTKKLHLSSNPIVIVLADLNAVKAERERIAQNNQKVLAQQEAKIQAEVHKNQSLLDSLSNKNDEYAKIAVELAVVKQQLAAFQEKKTYFENKIDSIADVLSLIDVVSLSIVEQQRIEKEKNGEWIDALTDQIINKIDNKLLSEYNDKIARYRQNLQTIANEYYNTYLKNCAPQAVNYFIYNYREYVRIKISSAVNSTLNSSFSEMLLEKILDDDAEAILKEHISLCQSNWEKDLLSTKENSTQTRENICQITSEKAKNEFLLNALYPEREKRLKIIEGRYKSIQSINSSVVSNLEQAHPEFVQNCQTIANEFVNKYSKPEDFDDLTKSDWIGIQNSIWRTIQMQNFFDASEIYYEFKESILTGTIINAMNALAERNNSFLDVQKEQLKKMEFAPISNKISNIELEKKCDVMRSWEKDKYDVMKEQDYNHYQKEYKSYFEFLDSIVMIFMEPIAKKYDTDDALDLWETSLENDVRLFCSEPIRNNYDILKKIDGMEGTNRCLEILLAIISHEKNIIVDKHNKRYEEFQQRSVENEQKVVDTRKNKKLEFESEADIEAFLSTHKFVSEEEYGNYITWYNSEISKYHIDMGRGTASYDISSYTIMEWNKKYAKIKINGMSNGPLIVKITLNGVHPEYSESSFGMTVIYRVIDK